MAIIPWDAAFELTPAGTDAKSQGDDRIRELKENLSTRLLQGGHVWKNATIAKDGLHAVNGGGAGVSPDIYKSDFATKLMAFADALIRGYENAQFDKDVAVTGNTALTGTLDVTGGTTIRNYLHSAITTISGPTTVTLSEVYTHVYVDVSGGAVTLNLPVPAVSTGIRHLVIHKITTGNTLTLSSSLLQNAPKLNASGLYTIGSPQLGSIWLIYDYAQQKWLTANYNFSPMIVAAGDADFTASSVVDIITSAPFVADRIVTLPDTAYIRQFPLTVQNIGVGVKLTTVKPPAGHFLNNIVNGTVVLQPYTAPVAGVGSLKYSSISVINYDATHWITVGTLPTTI